MHSVYLSLGSNKCYTYENVELSPHALLLKAYERLCGIFDNISVSSLYITKPMYIDEQENFYNIVIQGIYNKSAEELLDYTQNIESDFGRNRKLEIKNGPRSLDIDIILFSDCVISTDRLAVPHPKMSERAFVLVPLLEILSNNADKVNRDYYKECLSKVNSFDVIKKHPFFLEVENEPGPQYR